MYSFFDPIDTSFFDSEASLSGIALAAVLNQVCDKASLRVILLEISTYKNRSIRFLAYLLTLDHLFPTKPTFSVKVL
jgi:hypothetical protein